MGRYEKYIVVHVLMIPAILIVFLLMAAAVPKYAEAHFSEEALQVARNRLESLDGRKKALSQLAPIEDPQLTSELAQIIRNPEEPIALRAIVTDMLIASNAVWATLELKKIFDDAKLSMQCRQQALYALWKKDPEGMGQQLISLAQNSHEPVELRTAALTYLSATKADWPPKFWQNLYLNHANPVQIRAVALGGMETLGLLSQEMGLLSQVIQNPREPTDLRKLALLKATRNLSAFDAERESLEILSKPENSLEIREFALDNLPASRNGELVTELKQILTREANPDLRAKMKTRIDNLISK